MNRFVITVLGLLALAVLAAGCTPYQPPAGEGSFHQAEPDIVCVPIIDLSGSYAQYAEGPAWSALSSILRQLRQNQSGGDDSDLIVIGQISAVPIAPVFEGSTRAFGKQFSGGGAFKDYLGRHSNPAGSRVHDSIRDTLLYALPKVTGKGRAVAVIFSDMDDNLGGPDSEERLVQAFAEWGRKGGSVGLFWVDLPYVDRWRQNLRRAGIKDFVVESSINPDPKLPAFDK